MVMPMLMPRGILMRMRMVIAGIPRTVARPAPSSLRLPRRPGILMEPSIHHSPTLLASPGQGDPESSLRCRALPRLSASHWPVCLSFAVAFASPISCSSGPCTLVVPFSRCAPLLQGTRAGPFGRPKAASARPPRVPILGPTEAAPPSRAEALSQTSFFSRNAYRLDTASDVVIRLNGCMESDYLLNVLQETSVQLLE